MDTAKPLKVIQAWLRQYTVSPPIDTPMQLLSKQEYDTLGSKFSTGVTNSVYCNVRQNWSDLYVYLTPDQNAEVREILRDIESLDGHTSFLFNKINFQMDATVGFINVNQNKDLKRLTIISVIFMPLNLLAGIGGMSEFTMMTGGVSWPIAYGGFLLGLFMIGWLTFLGLRFFENKTIKKPKVHKKIN